MEAGTWEMLDLARSSLVLFTSLHLANSRGRSCKRNLLLPNWETGLAHAFGTHEICGDGALLAVGAPGPFLLALDLDGDALGVDDRLVEVLLLLLLLHHVLERGGQAGHGGLAPLRGVRHRRRDRHRLGRGGAAHGTPRSETRRVGL